MIYTSILINWLLCTR